MITAKTVKTVLDMNKNGIDKAEVAEKCGIGIQSVDDIIKRNNKDKIYISADTMSLWTIANELDCENDNILGIANLLFCAGNSVGELTAEGLYTLGNNLYSICEKLKELSESMSKLYNDKV